MLSIVKQNNRFAYGVNEYMADSLSEISTAHCSPGSVAIVSGVKYQLNNEGEWNAVSTGSTGANVDLSLYALKSEIPDVSNFITLADVPTIDLTNYTLKSELPDTSGFITSAGLTEALSEMSGTISGLQSQIIALQTQIADLNKKIDYNAAAIDLILEDVPATAVDSNGNPVSVKVQPIKSDELISQLESNMQIAEGTEILLVDAQSNDNFDSITLNIDVSNRFAEGVPVVLYHYGDNGWEKIGNATVDVNGYVVGTFTSLSPIAIVQNGDQKDYRFTSTSGKVSYANFSSLGSSGTYELLKDTTMNKRLVTGALASNVILDLNGHNFTSTVVDANYAAISMVRANQSLTIMNSKAEGGVIITADDAVGITSNATNSTIILGENITILPAQDCCGVLIEGANATLRTNANITVNGSFGIGGNGSKPAASSNPGNIIIEGGNITSDELGIYQPGNNNLTINGGVITGATAVYIKSGLNIINNGSFVGNGTLHAYEYNGNGAVATGDAIVIDSCDYPSGTPLVQIINGTFTSTNGKSVACYAGNGITETNSAFVDGGSFTPALDDEYKSTNFSRD